MGKRLRRWALVLLLLLGLWWLWQHRMGRPEDFGPMEDQYKYGSIGADHPLAAAPLPYWVWKVLPEVVSAGHHHSRRPGPAQRAQGLRRLRHAEREADA